MITDVLHIGVTVKDIDRSIAFYRDVMGLAFQGEILMEGPETDLLFRRKDCKARVAYLSGDKTLAGPPVELIQFILSDIEEDPADLFKTSISEICFETDDIWEEYRRMKELGVEFLSEPQEFDFTPYGFGKSMALYFKDPDGIILELIEKM